MYVVLEEAARLEEDGRKSLVRHNLDLTNMPAPKTIVPTRAEYIGEEFRGSGVYLTEQFRMRRTTFTHRRTSKTSARRMSVLFTEFLGWTA